MTDDPTILAARMCTPANGWLPRFERYQVLLETLGMTEEQAERIITEAYQEELRRVAA
jgi:hypothetical protein